MSNRQGKYWEDYQKQADDEYETFEDYLLDVAERQADHIKDLQSACEQKQEIIDANKHLSGENQKLKAENQQLREAFIDQREVLILYSEWLEKQGYTDTDWRTEEPFAIDEFLNQLTKGK